MNRECTCSRRLIARSAVRATVPHENICELHQPRSGDVWSVQLTIRLDLVLDENLVMLLTDRLTGARHPIQNATDFMSAFALARAEQDARLATAAKMMRRIE